MDKENSYITGIAHIGIAVPDINTAKQQFELLGYKAITPDIIFEEDHGVQAFMMENAGFVIELIAPLDKDLESPVDSYISSKPYKIYHVAYKVSDFDSQIDLLKANKFVMTDEPKTSSLQGGKRTVFMANRKMGVIELVED